MIIRLSTAALLISLAAPAMAQTPPTTTTTTTPRAGEIENDDGMDWGWLGLLGLAGLAGLMGRKKDTNRRDPHVRP